MGNYYHPFVVPFVLGVVVLFTCVLLKWSYWLIKLQRHDKLLIFKNFFSKATLIAAWKVIKESLLHVSIFKRNPILGFMHASLAFGWFLLIVMGFVETTYVIKGPHPFYVDIFFRYFDTVKHAGLVTWILASVMDILLMIVLAGVALAILKRISSIRMGMKKTTKHTPWDRVALSTLWLIFPARLIAESLTCGIYDVGGVVTYNIGKWLSTSVPIDLLATLELPAWWIYSLALAIFFVAMPFSRYMHIFTEIPHIFLQEYGVRAQKRASSVDNFQIQACSRCGLCIDDCQLQRDLGIRKQLPVYYLRDRRAGRDCSSGAEDCLICGRCEQACPVHLDINNLRINTRSTLWDRDPTGRYNYLRIPELKKSKVGYFSGCMTKLTPGVLVSMDKIFDAADEDYVHLDEEDGACCGRPLTLAGEFQAGRKMMAHNKKLFDESGITTLITSCPICYRVFSEEYGLYGIEVLHHSHYIDRLIAEGRISPKMKETKLTYHDPCELGRGTKSYDEPRRVIAAIGTYVESAAAKEKAHCCGSSLAHASLNLYQKQKLRDVALQDYLDTGADTLVTACPLCNTSFRTRRMEVLDLSEVVAGSL